MAHYENLPVYKAVYDLLLYVFRIGKNIQRDYRYTLGEDLKKRLFKILTLVYKATAALQKHTFIELAREEMVVVKLLLRVLCDLKQLSASAYAHAALLAESVSKQLVAWNKYCLQTNEQAG